MGYARKSLGLGAIGGILIALLIITSTYTYFTYGSGRLEIWIKDPPVWEGEVTHVYIRCSEIEIHRADEGNESGWITVLKDPGWINLTEVLETSKVLSEVDLQSGRYNAIRFEIIEANVTVDNLNQTAVVPSGKLHVVITHGGITVNVGQTSKVLIDLDTRVTYSHAKGYRLIPKVKALPLSDQ